MMLQILAAVDAAHCARRRGIVGIPSVHEVGAELIRTALPRSNLCRCSFIDATQSHVHTVVLTFSSPCHVLAAKSVVSSMATGQRLDREVGGQREAIQVLRDCLPTGSAVWRQCTNGMLAVGVSRCLARVIRSMKSCASCGPLVVSAVELCRLFAPSASAGAASISASSMLLHGAFGTWPWVYTGMTGVH